MPIDYSRNCRWLETKSLRYLSNSNTPLYKESTNFSSRIALHVVLLVPYIAQEFENVKGA